MKGHSTHARLAGWMGIPSLLGVRRLKLKATQLTGHESGWNSGSLVPDAQLGIPRGGGHLRA